MTFAPPPPKFICTVHGFGHDGYCPMCVSDYNKELITAAQKTQAIEFAEWLKKERRSLEVAGIELGINVEAMLQHYDKIISKVYDQFINDKTKKI